MPHIEYFVVSESVSVDQTNNAVSLFHIIEEYTFKKFPGRIPQLVITALWDIGEHEHEQDFKGAIRLTPPSSGESKDYPFGFRTDSSVPRQRVFLKMSDLSIPGPGEYRFDVYLNEEKYASHRIYLLESEEKEEAVAPLPVAQADQPAEK